MRNITLFLAVCLVLLFGCREKSTDYIPLRDQEKPKNQLIKSSDKTKLEKLSPEEYYLKEFEKLNGVSKSEFFIELVYSDSWSPAHVVRYYLENDTLKLSSLMFEHNAESWLENHRAETIGELKRTFRSTKYFNLKDTIVQKIESYELMTMPLDTYHAEDGYSVLVNILYKNKKQSILRWVPHARPQKQERNFTRFCKLLINSQTLGMEWSHFHELE